LSGRQTIITFTKNIIMENKPIAPLLKTIKVGDKAEYPMRRYSTIKTSIERVQKETGKKFSYRTVGSDEKSIIEVTRVL